MNPTPKFSQWAAAAGLVVLTVIAYLPIARAGFIFDDDSMLTDNRLIKAADGLSRFWFTAQASDYWPVTSTTLWIEWRLWGTWPLGYHLTNLALHAGEVVLLWAVLRRLRMPGAWLAALLFAVHPMNVESVAWIAQRKNLLAMLFYLASIWFYLKADLRAEPAKARRLPLRSGSRQAFAPPPFAPPSFASPWYWLSLLAFILAMLSKGSVAMLPLVLLGLTAWRRRLNFADIRRLAPFFAVAAVLTAVDVWFQHHGAQESIRSAGFLERLLGAGAVIWFYLGKAVWPIHLIFVYPQWRIQPADFLWWLPALAALGLTALFWRRRREWGRPWLFAWGYFCASLVPAMGFTDVYFMKYSLVADHYAHVALIGVAAGIACLGHRLHQRATGRGRPALVAFAAIVVGLLAGLTWRQLRMYRDQLTLFRTTVAQNPDSWLLHNNLGVILKDMPGEMPQAVAEFAAALRIRPDSSETHNNLGNVFFGAGRFPEAVAEYEEALRFKPDYPLGHNNLGNALSSEGRWAEAVAQYEEVLRLKPDYPQAHYCLGNALFNAGRLPEAIAEFGAELRLNPDSSETRNNLGNALFGRGRLAEALAQYELALRLKPDNAMAFFNVALTSLKLPGRIDEAMPQLEAAFRFQPDSERARQIMAQLRAAQSGTDR